MTQTKTAARPLPSAAPTAPAPAAQAAPQAAAGDRPFIHINGQLLPKSKALISVYDHGLLYGDGIFEGIRVYRGRIFKCKQHVDRLWRCAEAIRLKVPVTRARVVEIMRECVAANELRDGYIRLVVTRGYGTLGLDPRKCPTAGLVCIADQITLFPQEMYEKGMRVVVAHRPVNPLECLDPRVKTLNYLNHILAKCEGIDFGCHEVVRLNQQGFVAEGSGDNLFFVKDGVLYTPPAEAGILEGITREFVMKTLCPALNLRCVEKMFRLDELLTADEVFLTGSAAEIISITQIDQYQGKTITSTTRISEGEGPITRRLRNKFREIVTSDHVPEE